MAVLDETLDEIAADFPEIEALMDIHGVGVFTALLIVAEIGEPQRFPDGRKVGTYAGLTARVNQSGGHITTDTSHARVPLGYGGLWFR